MMTGANIPLSKTDHPLVRKFIQERVKNGGAIPGGYQLQDVYLPMSYEEERSKLIDHLKDKYIAVIFDEMSDDEGRFVLNILFAPLELDSEGRVLSYLADTVFLEKTNNTTVSQAVLSAVREYNISFDKVISIDTDNAQYMIKTFNSTLKTLFPNALHITCLAHIMDLIGSAFRAPYANVSEFIKCFKYMFYNAGARKARYLNSMKDYNQGIKVPMPPDPVGTRWNSWFHAVQYHAKYFGGLKGFLDAELEVCKSPPDSVVKAHDILQDKIRRDSLKLQLDFITAKCDRILTLNQYFQSRKPCATKAFDILEDLQIYFASHMEMTVESSFHFFEPYDDMSLQTKQDLLNLMEQSFQNAHDKLLKYLTVGQPAIPFLKAVRIFDPKKVPLLNGADMSEYFAIPGFEDTVAKEDFDLYFSKIVPDYVAAAAGLSCGSSIYNIDQFWDTVSDRVPSMAALANKYVNAVCNSADSERSFSLYSLILSSRRRSLSENKIKALCFLYYNLRVQSGAATAHDIPVEEIELGLVV